MLIAIIVSIVCFAAFVGLLQGTHHLYIAYADNEVALYGVAALICLMWACLIGGFVSLAFPTLKKWWQKQA